MKRLTLIATAAVCCWCAAGARTPAQQIAPTPPAELHYGRWGVDLAGGDHTVAPGDDFFRYANGSYIDRLVIPPDQLSYGPRILMTDLVEQRVHALLEDAASNASEQPSDERGKAGAFYAAFMDETRVERLGATPLQPTLDEIRHADSRQALAVLMGRSTRDFERSLFAVSIGADAKAPDRHAISISQDGLGLPDRDYYLDAKFEAQRSKYSAYVARLLRLIGWPDSEARAADVVALETRIADASWSAVERRDPEKRYTPMSVAELQAAAPDFPWQPFLRSADLADVNRVIVSQSTAIPKLASIYAATPVAVLQAWQAFAVADNAAPYLSRAFADAYFDLHDRTLGGQIEQKARWKRGLLAVSGGDFLASTDRFGRFGTLGWAVGDLYTSRYFPPESKRKIESLVANLKDAFAARLARIEWMDPETKGAARQKLAKLQVYVGYPDQRRDYSSVVVRRDDLLGNVRRAAAWEWGRRVSRISEPVDRAEWFMTPQTNDAYNSSVAMQIVFPAGILLPPMFDPDADPAVNYGAIGGVIGHEITHAFDDQGRKYDAEGRLADWWTAADARRFEAEAAKLGAQYSAFEPLPGMHVNGQLTMGENIADLGGLTLGLEAYRISLHGTDAPALDGVTGEQRVFLGWAQAWRTKRREDALRRQLVSDPHSPPQFRVNGPVRNIDAWYSAFAVDTKARLYLAPADRVSLW